MQGRRRENVDFVVNSRVKAARQALNLSQAEFCKAILMSAGHYAEIELGHRRVNERTVRLICSAYGVSPRYLTDGEGPMFTEDAGGKLEEVCRIFRELPADFQDHLLRHVRELKTLARSGRE